MNFKQNHLIRIILFQIKCQLLPKVIVESNSAFKELKDKIENISNAIAEIQSNISKQNFGNNLQESFQNLAHIATLTILELLHDMYQKI